LSLDNYDDDSVFKLEVPIPMKNEMKNNSQSNSLIQITEQHPSSKKVDASSRRSNNHSDSDNGSNTSYSDDNFEEDKEEEYHYSDILQELEDEPMFDSQ